MADYTSEFRKELNKRATEIINFLVDQNPSKVYWTNDELFEKFRGSGFNSKRDMALSIQAIGIQQRIMKMNEKVSRVYILGQF